MNNHKELTLENLKTIDKDKLCEMIVKFYEWLERTSEDSSKSPQPSYEIKKWYEGRRNLAGIALNRMRNFFSVEFKFKYKCYWCPLHAPKSEEKLTSNDLKECLDFLKIDTNNLHLMGRVITDLYNDGRYSDSERTIEIL